MEESEDLQLVIHLKKGIFQQMIRKKKLKQILSERRKKEDLFQQKSQSILGDDILQILKNDEVLKNKLNDFLFLYNLIIFIKQYMNDNNSQIVIELFNTYNLLGFLVKTLKNILNKEISTQFMGQYIGSDQVVLDIMLIFINLAYYINKNDLLYNQVIHNFCSAQSSEMEVDNEYSVLNLIEKIALKYTENDQILEYLIQFLNNLVYLEGEIVCKCLIQSKLVLDKVVGLIQKNKENKDLIDEITHFIYNLTRQNQFYSFEEINDVQYIIYIIIPLVKECPQACNRTIQSLSYTLDRATQQEFIDFIEQNNKIFEILSELLDAKDINLNEICTKDEETIQIIFEIFLLVSDILNQEDDQVAECLRLKQIIWLSCLKPYNYAQFKNTEILVLSLKIMNSILQNSSETSYFLRNILNVENKSSKILRNLIQQCCEWKNAEIVNEFISLLCNLFQYSQIIDQIIYLLTYGTLIILIESLKTEVLYYETRDEVFKVIIDLLNLEEKFDENQDICKKIRQNTQICLEQEQGVQIIENILDSQITTNTTQLLELILDQLNQSDENL